MKEITIPSPAGDIYAVLSPAVGETSSDKPLVVICHGLMMNSWLNPVRGISDGFNAAGYDTLRFDFRGSGQSTGNVTEMTPLTEVGDLQAVISYVQLALTRNIILCGHSLGGLVSLITAEGLEQAGENILKGLVMFAPAVNVEADSKAGRVGLETFDPVNIPDTVAVWGSELGRCYFTTAMNLDTYRTISGYTGPLCVLMGERDKLVTCDYSSKINAALPQAELHVIPKGDHLFSRGIRAKALDIALEFMSRL